jgi:hypothetical protein
VIASPPPVYPWPIGVSPRYHPTAHGGSAHCQSAGRSFAVHIELFARRKVVIVPPGIGACDDPVRTTAPTGVVHVVAAGRSTLGDLFRIWGRRLTGNALLSFRGRVSVFLGGRRWRGEPGRVPLTKRTQVVVEIGGYVAPHSTYLFPKGAG